MVITAATAALIRPQSTDDKPTTSEKTMNAYGVLEKLLCRQAHFDEEDARCLRENFVFFALDTYLRAGHTGRMVTPPQGARKCSCASKQEERRCVLPLCHCPLPIQNHELSKGRAHLVFSMRVANSTSWPDALTIAIAKSGDAANRACEFSCQEATRVAYRQPAASRHVCRAIGATL